jgi:hypothetical protein
MKRWMFALLLCVFGLQGIGCHVDADDDDDAELKVKVDKD